MTLWPHAVAPSSLLLIGGLPVKAATFLLGKGNQILNNPLVKADFCSSPRFPHVLLACCVRVLVRVCGCVCRGVCWCAGVPVRECAGACACACVRASVCGCLCLVCRQVRACSSSAPCFPDVILCHRCRHHPVFQLCQHPAAFGLTSLAVPTHFDVSCAGPDLGPFWSS